MQLDVTQLEEKDYGRYEKLNQQSPCGSVFSSITWPYYRPYGPIVLGAFRGQELVGAGVFPIAGNGVVRYVPRTPWCGPIHRPESSESERWQIAKALVEYLLARYDEVTLTLPPEWDDVRPFTWLGMRHHIRYTYRGRGHVQYERRVKVRECSIKASPASLYGPGWWSSTVSADVSTARILWDWKCAYWWEANEGGTWHTELIDSMIRRADELGRGFDMVGCNSPTRGLFKRGFGGRLVPYYSVTTAVDIADLRAMPVGATAQAA